MPTKSGMEKSGAAWLVVVASSVGLFLHFGSLLVNAFGIFLTALCDEFGWSRGEVSFAFTLATLTAMLAFPLTGWLVDKLGPRRPILLTMTLFGALYASLAWLTPNLWHLYAVFLLLGLMGPGTSAVPHAKLISSWFTERRGLALGVAMCGTALGGVIWPTASQALLNGFGLRQSYLMTGGAVLLIAVPLMLALLREPASLASAMAGSDEKERKSAEGMTRGEALKNSLFWLLIFAFFTISISIHAGMIHLVPMLKDRGMTAESAALAASLMGAAGMIGRLGTGYLLDILPAERVPAFAFSLVAAGLFILFTGASGMSAYGAALLIGFGYGAETATIPYMVSHYFGLRSFGEIYSYLFITVPLGGAFGPTLMGMAYDRTGSYGAVLLACAIATLVSALLLLRLGSYRAFTSQAEARAGD